MTNELWAALIGAVVLLLTNTAAAVKLSVMKNSWDIQALKDMSGHRDQVIEQLQQQITILNSTMATTNLKLDTLTEAIKELKDK